MHRRFPAATFAPLACLLFLLLARPAAAQEPEDPVDATLAAAVEGVVQDAQGAAIAGASIAAVNEAGVTVRRVRSDEQGKFRLGAVPAGTFAIAVDAAAFERSVRNDVRVASGQTVAVAFVLVPSTFRQSVVVTSNASRSNPTAPGLRQGVPEEQVRELPLNGRSVITLSALVPGVALPPGSLLPRINGGRPRTNEYLFDGIAVLQPEPGQVPFFPTIDAIGEFRIERNSPPAEFGRFNGGVVAITTKAGTNTPSGRMFDFVRHESLNARNPLAVGQDRPTFRRQQFGGAGGGPLAPNRTFLFADYQGQRQKISRTVVSTVPTMLQRQGIFTEPIAGRVPAIYDPISGNAPDASTRLAFPGNTIPSDRIDRVAAALLGRYPLPTREGTANNYVRAAPETVDQDQFGVRIDQNISPSGNRVFARVAGFRETFVPVTPLPDGSGATTGTLGPQDTHAQTFASSYDRTIGTAALNELRVGDSRRRVSRTAVELPVGAGVDLGLPGIPETARFASVLPSFQIAGYQPLGSPPNTASDFRTSVTQIADTLTWVTGAHTFKAGADVRWSSLDVVQPPSPTGLFQFSNLFTDLPGVTGTGSPFASFLLGQVQNFSIDLQQDEIRQRAHMQEYFVQDEWRVSDRITLSAGLRYTLNSPSYEQNDQAAVLDFSTRRLVYLGADGQPRTARRLHWGDFGPRFAVSALVSPRSLLRGGYGRIFIEQAGITTPFTTPVFPFLQTVSQRTLDNIAPALVLAGGPTVQPVPLTPDAGLGQGVFGVNRDQGSGYVQQWHAAWQHDLTRHTQLELSYMGSRVTRVGVPDANLNQLTEAQLSLGSALLERVPNPYVGVIPASTSLGESTITRAQLLKPFPEYTAVSLYRNNIGTTDYHGVDARIERRFSGGLSSIASYTWSRLVDDASSVFDASILTGPVTNAPVADAFDRSRDRDRSTGDIPHVFAASAVWELPWGAGRKWHPSGAAGALANGWTFSGILTLQSGTPVAVTQQTNFNAFAGFGTQRPNVTGDPSLPTNERTTGRWFDVSAFSAAPQFTLGSASRNPVRGPAYRNLDVAIMRTLELTGGVALDLRLEAFNVTNTPAWGNPNGVFGSPAFGTITSAGDPRVLQVAARLVF